MNKPILSKNLMTNKWIAILLYVRVQIVDVDKLRSLYIW